VVDLAEKREEEIRRGSKGRVDGKWVEDKEEAAERTREAVLAAMKSGDYKDTTFGSHIDSQKRSLEAATRDNSSSSGEETREINPPDNTPPSVSAVSVPSRSCFGFDEEDDFMSDDSESEVLAAQ